MTIEYVEAESNRQCFAGKESLTLPCQQYTLDRVYCFKQRNIVTQ